ncbi:hypothetical protein [Lactobacillus terrae]|uniref:hypothetical protein n=1 Tax=Lactobacillus terrae TaxID=2269374 RepID=UPI000C1B7755|nr:hypothetical protein [Lactobacillus terrae]
MVRITKISASIILLILAIVLMLKTGFEGFIAALIGAGAIGSAAGILIAFTYIISGAIYLITNRSYSIVPDVICFIILILGALIGFFNGGVPDTRYLLIWSWLSIAIGAIVLIISIVDLINNPVPTDEPESQQSNRQQSFNNNQNPNMQYSNFDQNSQNFQQPQNQYGQQQNFNGYQNQPYNNNDYNQYQNNNFDQYNQPQNYQQNNQRFRPNEPQGNFNAPNRSNNMSNSNPMESRQSRRSRMNKKK